MEIAQIRQVFWPIANQNIVFSFWLKLQTKNNIYPSNAETTLFTVATFAN